MHQEQARLRAEAQAAAEKRERERVAKKNSITTTNEANEANNNNVTPQIITNKRPHHSGPQHHNQYLADPLGHFLSIPWTARALTDPRVLDIVVSDRTRLASGDKQFVRTVLSSGTTVRACVTYFLWVPPSEAFLLPVDGEDGGDGGGGGGEWLRRQQRQPLSLSGALLRGGGPDDGEDPERPFLLFNALLDLGEDLCGFKGTLHGGALMVLLDETMCAAADNQSNYAFTATMTTNFLKPVKLPGVVVVRSRVVRKAGRKIWVRGSIEDGEGNLMVESEAMLVDKTPEKRSKL